MDDLDALERRIDAALGRIRAAIEAARSEGPEDPAQVTRLEKINESLRGRVKEMERKREADVAQLDALIAELRPLVEEVGHA
ncbi:MAG: hypothetical protein ACPGID_06735 [Rubricella sp.]